VTGWQYASWLLVPGPVLGLLAMRGLGAEEGNGATVRLNG
jgi:hypothetical protein